MRHGHAVLDGRTTLLDLREIDIGVPVANRLSHHVGDVVHRSQRVDERAQRIGQRFIRGVHAREAGIAANARQLHRPQQRSHRRVGEERVVAVPHVTAFALGTHLVEHHHRVGVLVLRRERRDMQWSESQRKGEMLLVVDVLIAKEQHEVVEQRLAQRVDRAVVELLA